MSNLTDFWGDELVLGDHVVYCVGQLPRLGCVIKIHARQVTIRPIGQPRRNTRFQSEFDLRTSHNVIRASGPRLTARLLATKFNQS